MRRRQDVASGVWELWRRARIGGRNGGSWALSSFFILVWLAVARGGRRRGLANATLSYLTAGDYIQEGLDNLVNDGTG